MSNSKIFWLSSSGLWFIFPNSIQYQYWINIHRILALSIQQTTQYRHCRNHHQFPICTTSNDVLPVSLSYHNHILRHLVLPAAIPSIPWLLYYLVKKYRTPSVNTINPTFSNQIMKFQKSYIFLSLPIYKSNGFSPFFCSEGTRDVEVWASPLVFRYIPDDILSLEDMDRVFFFNLCVQCLAMLSPLVLDHPGFICTEADLSHSNCVELAESFIVCVLAWIHF